LTYYGFYGVDIMREIKFRGYDEENKCWRYGHLFETVEGIRRCYNIVEGREVKYYVSPESIGQYTGLHDKNGKEIYEGDILREQYGYDETPYNYHVVKIGKSEDVRYCVSAGRNVFVDVIESLEICGNIHENPELIK
jgi:uncharacterized phage protein (TIGR01671 family)